MSSYRSEFASLWEQSKREHVKNIQDQVLKFKRRVRRFPSLLSLLLSVIPYFRRKLATEQIFAETQFSAILTEYIPQIRQHLKDVECYFNLWEAENMHHGMGSSHARRSEDHAREESKRLWTEMTSKLESIPKYQKYFRELENPTKMVSNPYPGYLSAERALNYCDFLLENK